MLSRSRGVGHANECTRKAAREKSQALFSMWDRDGTGAIPLSGIVEELSAMGLGGSEGFSKMVLDSALCIR